MFLYPSQNSYKPSLDLGMATYSSEKRISSTLGEILWYRQTGLTHRHPITNIMIRKQYKLFI